MLAGVDASVGYPAKMGKGADLTIPKANLVAVRVDPWEISATVHQANYKHLDGLSLSAHFNHDFEEIDLRLIACMMHQGYEDFSACPSGFLQIGAYEGHPRTLCPSARNGRHSSVPLSLCFAVVRWAQSSRIVSMRALTPSNTGLLRAPVSTRRGSETFKYFRTGLRLSFKSAATVRKIFFSTRTL